MLIIVGDDIGYGHMGAFGGRPYADLRPLAKQGLKTADLDLRTGPSSG